MARAPERIGRYELVTLLATGGMGKIHLARMHGMGGFERHVVVKTLELVDEEEHDVKSMFLDEARVLGVLHHQHIAPVFEVAEDDGQLFLVLDYVHGRNAQHVWERARELGAALPLDFTLTVVAAAASGLHYAHTRRDANGSPLDIIHRDVSPANIMIGFDGAVKMIDFGIAKSANRTVKTQTGFVKGKLGYMAPEQVRMGDVDPRTDVFALGVVLYELTTMARAFREESDRMTLERIKSAAYVRPSQLVPDYPKELERVIAKALRVDPRERFPDAEAMRKAIDALGHRYELVLGDAAIAEIMQQLFDDRREPWQRIETRPETSLEVPLEVVAPPDDRPAPRAKKFRSATEAVDALGDGTPDDHTIEGGDATLDAPIGEMTVPAARRFETDNAETRVAAQAYPGTLEVPAIAVEPPPDRVSKIQRLFTESSFDPAETPRRPIELPVEPRPAEIPARGGTHRGIGIDTDGVEILPARIGVDTDGVEILPAQAPAVTFKPPVPAKPPAGSGKRIAWIAIATIVLGAAAIVIYTLASSEGGAPVEADATVVHAPAVDAATDVAQGEPIDTAVAATPDAVTATPDAAVVATPDAVAVDATRAAVDAGVIDAGAAKIDAGDRPDAAAPRIDAGSDKPVHAVHLKITSTPDGATVELDGNRLGKTPYDGSVDVANGKHVLKLRRSGYTPIKVDLELPSDLERDFPMTKTKTDKEREPEKPKEDTSKDDPDL